MYSGCEFVDRDETFTINQMGQGNLPRRYGEKDIRVPFKPMKFPEGITFKKFVSHGTQNSFALDTSGTVWVMGRKFAYNDYYNEETTDDNDLIPDYKDEMTPCKIVWFEKNGVKVIDIAASQGYAMCLVEDNQGHRYFYVLNHPDYHYQL